jgi:hypothetical protein
MNVVPRIIERSTNLLDFQIPRKAGVFAYRISGHKTLDGAFAAPDVIIDKVRAGDTFASPSIKKKNLAHYEDSVLGVTRFRIDINDYSQPTNNLPLDDFQLYFIIEEYLDPKYLDPTVNPVTQSPIVIIPPTVSYSVRFLSVVTQGTVPQDASALPGEPPPAGSMFITLPGQAVTFTLNNLSATDTLMIALDEGTPLVEVGPNSTREVFELRTKQVAVVSTAAGIPFSLIVSVNAD